MTAQTSPLRVFRAKRPNIIRSAVSLLMLGLASMMFLEADSLMLRGLSWASIAFTLVVIVRLTVRFIAARDVTVTEKGFWLGRGNFIGWDKVLRFGTLDMKRQSFVVFTLVTPPERSGMDRMRLRGLPADITGYLPAMVDASVPEVLDYMNRTKRQYG